MSTPLSTLLVVLVFAAAAFALSAAFRAAERQASQGLATTDDRGPT